MVYKHTSHVVYYVLLDVEYSELPTQAVAGGKISGGTSIIFLGGGREAINVSRGGGKTLKKSSFFTTLYRQMNISWFHVKSDGANKGQGDAPLALP